MKTKQIPDDFRDWTEARTFEISAPIAWPTGLPLDYLKRIIIRQPAISTPTDESPLEAHTLGNLKRRDDAPLDLLSEFSGALAN